MSENLNKGKARQRIFQEEPLSTPLLMAGNVQRWGVTDMVANGLALATISSSLLLPMILLSIKDTLYLLDLTMYIFVPVTSSDTRFIPTFFVYLLIYVFLLSPCCLDGCNKRYCCNKSQFRDERAKYLSRRGDEENFKVYMV